MSFVLPCRQQNSRTGGAGNFSRHTGVSLLRPMLEISFVGCSPRRLSICAGGSRRGTGFEAHTAIFSRSNRGVTTGSLDFIATVRLAKAQELTVTQVHWPPASHAGTNLCPGSWR